MQNGDFLEEIMTAYKADEAKKAKIIKASNTLQSKVGLGSLDPKVVSRCQEVIDNNKVDFAPIAKECLTYLQSIIKKVQAGTINKKVAVEAMTEPVMQLKAHASLFHYDLVGTLAGIMLGFLEAIDEIDNDVLRIVDAHHQTLKSIIINKLEGNGGKAGEQLKSELYDACRRYYAKKNLM
jgi:hypothetical protein